MTLLEAIVLARLLMELLAIAPQILSNVESHVAQVKAAPDGEEKAAAILDGIGHVANIVAPALQAGATGKENDRG